MSTTGSDSRQTESQRPESRRPESQRIDKWLWHARVAKTRTLAASLVAGGHVRVNRAKVSKASQPLRVGDTVTVALNSRILVLRVVQFAARRGPAAEARTLYEDLSPPPPPKPDLPPLLPAARRAAGAGRPTKKERRQIDAWNDNPTAPRSSKS